MGKAFQAETTAEEQQAKEILTIKAERNRLRRYLGKRAAELND